MLSAIFGWLLGAVVSWLHRRKQRMQRMRRMQLWRQRLTEGRVYDTDDADVFRNVHRRGDRPAAVLAACMRCRASCVMWSTHPAPLCTPLPLRCDCGGLRYVSKRTAEPD